MSDSEDEGSFASADEGEEVAKGRKGQKKSQLPSTGTKKGSGKSETEEKITGGAAGAKKSPPNTKTPTAGAAKPEPKKGKERQQQKKRGKGNNQQQEKQQTEKCDTTPAKSSPSEVVDQENPGLKEEQKTPAGSEAKSSTDVKDSNEERGQKSPSPSSKPSDSKPNKKSDSDAIGSGDASESSVSKKAGDVRKGIPSDETSPQNQSISRDEPQSPGKASSGQADAKSDSGGGGGGGGWGWSSWGSSLLTVASSSVQTFTSQVGDGFNTIMDTVESSLGAVDPEDLLKEEEERKARAKAAATVTSQPLDEDEEGDAAAKVSEKEEKGGEGEKKQLDKDQQQEEEKTDSATASGGGAGGWFSSWGVSELAKKVQDTGKSLATKGQTLMTEGFDAVENLASGGIDVLESIGKKTYTTLSEHDPAFKKTREYLRARTKSDKPNLSSLLREAKEQAEEEAAATKENEEARKAHFGTQFDEFQGIAHLEALEMLSNQSEKKVHSLLNSLSSSDLKVIKPILISIKEAFEVDEEGDDADDEKDQDFSGLVSQCVSELELGSAPDKLNKVHAMVKQWMVDFETQESHDGETIKGIHQRAIQSLAELTSKGVEQFHKAGELVLMQRDADKDCKERAHSFARLTGVLCHEIGNLATKFSDCLNKIAPDQDHADEVKTMVTNIYLEATNSSTYIQDAFQLLLPVLQQAAIEHNILSRQS